MAQVVAAAWAAVVVVVRVLCPLLVVLSWTGLRRRQHAARDLAAVSVPPPC